MWLAAPAMACASCSDESKHESRRPDHNASILKKRYRMAFQLHELTAAISRLKPQTYSDSPPHPALSSAHWTRCRQCGNRYDTRSPRIDQECGSHPGSLIGMQVMKHADRGREKHVPCGRAVGRWSCCDTQIDFVGSNSECWEVLSRSGHKLFPACVLQRHQPEPDVQRLKMLIAVLLARERCGQRDAAAAGCTPLAVALTALPSRPLELIADAVAALGSADVGTAHPRGGSCPAARADGDIAGSVQAFNAHREWTANVVPVRVPLGSQHPPDPSDDE